MRRFLFYFVLSFAFLIPASIVYASSPTPLPTPVRPRAVRFFPLSDRRVANALDTWPCDHLVNPEFHPLRPYPASPCDPFIPAKIPEAPDNDPNLLYLTFQCSKSANPTGTYTAMDVINAVDGIDVLPTPWSSIPLIRERHPTRGVYTRSADYLCAANSTSICFVKEITVNVALNYRDSQLPIAGNTQNYLTDVAKVNNYLSWYFNGTIQQAEQEELDATDPEDLARIINYTGPIKKLLSYDTQAAIHQALQTTSEIGDQFHNYNVNDSQRITGVLPTYPNIPFSSHEDTTSEMTVAIVPGQQPVSPEIDGTIFQIGLYVGTADSRLYFPHLKNINALSQILSSTYRPHPDGLISPTPLPEPNPVDVTNPDLLNQRTRLHQGFGATEGHPDTTAVERFDVLTNSNTRNTEVIESAPAPAPLYDVPDIRCTLSDVRTNQGDDLVGSVVNVVVIYRQLFRYSPQRIIMSPCPSSGPSGNCISWPEDCQAMEGDECNDTTSLCCWGTCPPEPIPGCENNNSVPGYCEHVTCTDDMCQTGANICCEWEEVDPPTCPAWPTTELRSMSRISTFTKTPYVERIYDTILSGTQSIMHRFLPYSLSSGFSPDVSDPITAPESARVTSTGAEYTGTTYDLNNLTVTAGTGGAPALYFPRLGSLFDHFLGSGGFNTNINLQCILRPYGNCRAVTNCDNYFDNLPEADAACGVCNSDLGELAQRILTAAGSTFNVPAAAIWATMWHEGATWPEYLGQFTDENVSIWSLPEICGGQPMPRCNNDEEGTQPPFGWIRHWFYDGDGEYAPWNAVQEFDPEKDTREEVSRCNFLDAAYATAKALHNDSAMWAGTTCGSYTFVDNVRPTSCTWTDVKFAQSQRGYAGQCPNDGTYEDVPYTIEDLVDLFHGYQCY